MTPQRLALLAGQGLADVEVRRKVRIGLISTGSELKEPGEILDRGQLYNSNRVMIRPMLAACSWADTLDFGIIPDHRKALFEPLAKLPTVATPLSRLAACRPAKKTTSSPQLNHHGGKLDVLKVAMRPGKPVKIG